MTRPERARSHAVLFGVSEFLYMSKMPQAERSLTDLGHRLAMGFADRLAVDRYLNVPDPSGALDVLARVAGEPLDLLLVYYVGHGLRDSADRLCLGLPGSRDNGHDVRRTSLPVEAVLTPLRRARARQRVVILDCCYSGLALDEVAAADLHLLVAASRTERAGNTDFTRELVHFLEEGVPDGGPWLTLGEGYQRIAAALGATGRTEPIQRVVNRGADTVIGVNPAYGTARTVAGLRLRARHADRVGRHGYPVEAATLFAVLVADAATIADTSDLTRYRRAHARWVGEAGDPRTAVAMLDALLDSTPTDEHQAIRTSREHWSARVS